MLGISINHLSFSQPKKLFLLFCLEYNIYNYESQGGNRK